MLRRSVFKLLSGIPFLSFFNWNAPKPLWNPHNIQMKFTGFHSADYYIGSMSGEKTMLQSLPYYNDDGTQVFIHGIER